MPSLSKKERKEIEQAPLGKKLNFNQFWEDSQKKYRKQYEQEKAYLEYKKFDGEQFKPTISSFKNKKKSKSVKDIIKYRNN